MQKRAAFEVAPAPREAAVRARTWAYGLTSWALLLAGMPLCTIAFIGCFGALFELAALAFIVAFVIGVVNDTESARGRFRGLGLLCLLAAIVGVLLAAWEPVKLFGYEVKVRAERAHHLSGPESATGNMRLDVWWEDHPRIGLAAWWIGAATLFAGGLRLLGVKAKGWLAAAFVAAGVTGPILLHVCTALVKDGWRSGN